MKKTYYYIYETTNLINGKTYIGQHITKRLSDGYKGSGYLLKQAFKKYGKENFRREILMFAVNVAALNFMEKCLITEAYVNSDDNYNLKLGGFNGLASLATRLKMSKTRLGKVYGPPSLETRLKISAGQKGKIITKEHREKLSKAGKGKIISEETRKKISDSNKNKFVSEETRRKISAAHIGKSTKQYVTDITRKKISDLRKNESQITRIKRSITNTGKKRSPEICEKMSNIRSLPFPPIYNIHTGETIDNGIGASKFCKIRNLNKANFSKMLQGKNKSCKGWILLRSS